jgi:hypothetical protein
MTTSLRDELRAEPMSSVPRFHLLLPPGWVSEEPTRENLDQLADRVSAVFRGAHRPDLDARFRGLMRRATADLLRRDPVRMIYPGGDLAPEDVFPLSIVATRLVGPGGDTLDAKVGEIVRSHDARPFDEEGQILRWHADGRVEMDGGAASVRSFNYLVAIPGTGRREAVLFSGTVPVAAGGEQLEEDTLSGAQALLDAIMSTFRWS